MLTWNANMFIQAVQKHLSPLTFTLLFVPCLILMLFSSKQQTSLMGFALLGALNSSIWKRLVWCTLPPSQDSQVHRVRIARSKATWRNKEYRSTDTENRIIIFHLFVAQLASRYFRIASMQLESHVFDIRLERIWDTMSRGIRNSCQYSVLTAVLKSTTCM